MNERVARLEALLAAGTETAEIRFGLGSACLASAPAAAAAHLARAVEIDPGYSAAWKLLGQALAADHRPAEARAAYLRGIAAAEARGDVQAGREMRVFLRRLGG